MKRGVILGKKLSNITVFARNTTLFGAQKTTIPAEVLLKHTYQVRNWGSWRYAVKNSGINHTKIQVYARLLYNFK